MSTALTLGIAMPTTSMAAMSQEVGAANNTNSVFFPKWMHDQSMQHSGRISRQMFMDETGHRWDAMDKSKKGLTKQELDRAYGYAPSGHQRGSPASTGSTAFPTWMDAEMHKHHGRMSRSKYMSEVEHRWDAMDKDHQGLTVEQVTSTYNLTP